MAHRVVFHIGLAKTGTTSFQHFCHDHRRLLARHGILYPRQGLGRGRNHSPLVASYIAHRPEGPSVALRWAPRAEAVQALTAEIDASPAATALISSEHFSTHFDRLEARELAADFRRYDCLVVIVLRDPYGRFLSSYNTHVTAGGRLGLEDYARSMLVPGTRFMNGWETVKIWQEAFGAERIRVIDYDATSDVTAAILQRCGLDVPLSRTADYRHRVSLGPDAIEALRCVNAAIAARQSVPPESHLAAWLQLSLFSYMCRRQLARHDAGPRPWPVSVETMVALDAIAAEERPNIAVSHGVVLRGSRARQGMVVTTPAAADAGNMLLANGLLDKIAPGLWAPIERLVALSARLNQARTRSHGKAQSRGLDG